MILQKQSTVKKKRGMLCVEPADIPGEEWETRWECDVRSVRIMQKSLLWSATTPGQYAAAVGLEVSDYFLTKDGIWCNGLDGEQTVEGAIIVFANLKDAIVSVHKWAGYHEARYISAYRLSEENGLYMAENPTEETRLIANEILRIETLPNEKYLGRILFRNDEECPLAILDEAIPGRPPDYV